jgi:lipoprotein-anchoring transpeptidase ErfK/SrfK
VALSTGRVAGADRYGTAVAVARTGYPGWAGVKRVIIASGDSGSLSDPLAAASLCWAYDAPLLLTRPGSVPADVRGALDEMRSVNGTITVTVVGGSSAVRGSAVAELEGIVGPGNVEQPWMTGDRYALAAGIAARTAEVAAETSRTIPAKALVANGTDAAGFADALALSAVSARTGVPVLLVERDRVPDATTQALNALPGGQVYVAGGTAVVSDATLAAVGARVRFAGRDRYATAAEVAGAARYRGWLAGDTVGLASTVSDALTGATLIGRSGGAILYVGRDAVLKAPAMYLHRWRGTITKATLFGGTAVLSEALAAQVKGAPAMPRVVTPVPGSRLAKKANLTVATGVNTTQIEVFVGSTSVAKRAVPSFSTVDLGTIATPADGGTYRVVARNPGGGQAEGQARYTRYSYPAPTSIVVDKSDFRLYWFLNDVFIKSYPVAIGRPSLETPARIWRIDSKYYSDPNGVYGPRKMRLYRQSGSSFVRTGYLIHGTNEPWVIGTKASHGCIRLYNKDILDLWPRVPLGTIVQTRE